MRLLQVFSCAMLAFLNSNFAVVAQDRAPQTSASYMPSLGDMMAVIQLRHAKIWYAANLKNWSLADYELRQLMAGLKETTRLYANMPSSGMTEIEKVAVRTDESIKVRNVVGFEKAFAELTNECNNCHQATDRAFIVVRRPIFPSPFVSLPTPGATRFEVGHARP
jgi:hypothetical protein